MYTARNKWHDAMAVEFDRVYPTSKVSSVWSALTSKSSLPSTNKQNRSAAVLGIIAGAPCEKTKIKKREGRVIEV